MKIEDLIKIAIEAQNNAYVPYSHFKVGAALLSKKGKIYGGCNIENHGIMSICAERVAFSKALSEGEKNFEAMVVVGAEELTTPCGYCRQFISEFVESDFKIYIVYGEGFNKIKEYTIEELLPCSFKLKH